MPADLRLFDVNELAIDERGFTGESVAKYKTLDTITANSAANAGLDICDMNNIAFQGTLVTSGKGTGVVISTGENSQFGVSPYFILFAQSKKYNIEYCYWVFH